MNAEEQLEIIKYGNNAEYAFTAASLINLQSEGRFTSYLSAFDYGGWRLQDSTLILTTHNKGRLALNVKSLTSAQMVCVNKNNQEVYRFNGFKNSFPSKSENPFAISNNLWRVRPNHKGTDGELTSRLKNHFRWWEKYFSWALNNEVKILDIRSTPSLLKLYANGFELNYYEYQIPEWRKIFYDTVNCWRHMKWFIISCTRKILTGLKRTTVLRVLFLPLNNYNSGWILIPKPIYRQKKHPHNLPAEERALTWEQNKRIDILNP